MSTDPFQAYCGAVCAMVRWKPYHAAISAELTDHMQDHAAALTAGGMEYPQARQSAAEAMGDPYVLGKELDALHSPWYPRLSRVFLFLSALILLVGIIAGLNGTLFQRRFAPFADPVKLVLQGSEYTPPRTLLATGSAIGGGSIGPYAFSRSGAAALFRVEGEGQEVSYTLNLVFSSTTPYLWLDHFRGDEALQTLRQGDSPARQVNATLYPLPQQGVFRRFYDLSVHLDAPISGSCDVALDGVHYSFILEEAIAP